MANRQRTPSFRPQFSMRRVYETMQPQSETKESPEAYILSVYLPGFSMDSVKITYEAPSKTMRITGERQIQGARWVRFDQSYPVPDYCEPEAVKGRFQTPILTLTLPKKTSQGTPKQQVETTQEKEKGVVAETKPDQKGQDTIPPQPTITTTKVEEPIEDKKSASPPRQEQATVEDTPSQIPSEPIKPQNGKEETVERVSAEVISKPQTSEKELEPKPTPTRATIMQKDQKLQTGTEEAEELQKEEAEESIKEEAEVPQKEYAVLESPPVKKATPTMFTQVVYKEYVYPKPTTVAPKIKTDEESPKGQDEVQPKHATNVTRKPTVKEQLEEKKTEGTSAVELEKEKMSNKEAKGEPSESRKLTKDKEQSDSEEDETKKKEYVCGYVARKEGPFAPKKKKEGKSEENAMQWFGSVFQAASKIAEGIWNEEEKKLAANVSAAVLVIAALGAYVSYRFAS